MHAGLMPFLHLRLPGDESQQAAGNTSMQELEAAVPNSEVFTSTFNRALALPAVTGESSTQSANLLEKPMEQPIRVHVWAAV